MRLTGVGELLGLFGEFDLADLAGLARTLWSRPASRWWSGENMAPYKVPLVKIVSDFPMTARAGFIIDRGEVIRIRDDRSEEPVTEPATQ